MITRSTMNPSIPEIKLLGRTPPTQVGNVNNELIMTHLFVYVMGGLMSVASLTFLILIGSEEFLIDGLHPQQAATQDEVYLCLQRNGMAGKPLTDS